jgi:hypothetical protein
VSGLWTYHKRYDFNLLLIPARFLWQKLWRREQLQLADFVELTAYAAVALALTDMIYLTDHKVAWLLRWYGRAALAGLFVHAALRVRADALQNRSAAAS